MTAKHDYALLVEVLDREVSAALSHQDTRILLAVPRLLDLLTKEPRLAGVVQDLRAEDDRKWGEYREVVALLAEQLGQVVVDCGEALEKVREGDTSDQGVWAENGYDHLEERIKAAASVEVGSCTEPPTRLPEVLFWVAHWLGMGFAAESGTWCDSRLSAANSAVAELKAAHETSWFALRAHLESHGGAAFRRVWDAATVLERVDGDTEDALAAAMHNRNVECVWSAVDDERKFGYTHENGLLLPSEVRQAIEVLHLAVRSRLVLGCSRSFIMRRYAARCEAFDRERILEVVRQSAGEVEKSLTLDFARFLFDQGFNPIVNAEVAGLRPDVLDPSLQPCVYVEAKQYSNADKGSLRSNIDQVFDTWRSLRNRYSVPEAFLLVFIVGGRGLELPPSIAHQGLRLVMQVVDVRPNDQRGSRAKQGTIILTERDLLPPEEAP